MKTIKMLNNWGAAITDASVSTGATSFNIETSAASEIGTLGDNEILIITASNGSDLEIMHVTARSGDTLTVERARDGTSALAYSLGDVIESRIPACFLDFLVQKGGNSIFTYLSGRIILTDHGTLPGVSDDDAICAEQTRGTPGYLTLTTDPDPYYTPEDGNGANIPREITLTSANNCSGVNITINYNNEDDSINEDTFAGPNATTVYCDVFCTKINWISVSGSITAIKIGIGKGLIRVSLNDGEGQKLVLNNDADIEITDAQDGHEAGMKLYLTSNGNAVSFLDTFKADYGNLPVLADSGEDILVLTFHGTSGNRYIHHIGRKMS